MTDEPPKLRRGWTTGACATAALKAALTALYTGQRPETVTITLPKGETPTFALHSLSHTDTTATASVIKDAGDDPDVTHGAEICAHVTTQASGLTITGGTGVGIVTKPGLPVPVGQAAINPVPMAMMRAVVEEMTGDDTPDLTVTISVPNGAALALKTWNPRLGITGGLSILGTTGIVRPFSCAAWIASIHRGIDVARATGTHHVAGCTGSTSEHAVQTLYDLPDHAMLDMGDFAGGMLKYLAKNPVAKVTIGGGFGKITKLAQGARDLHSRRSQVDFDRLAATAASLGADPELVANANTAMEALSHAPALAAQIAKDAHAAAAQIIPDAQLDIVIIDRVGTIVGRSP